MGDVIEIPMPQVKLVRVYKNWFIVGRYTWWGKSCFKLETPKTKELVLGFDDPGPWEHVFSAN